MHAGAMLANARRGPARGAQEKFATRQAVTMGILLVLAVGVVLGIVFGVKALQAPDRPLLGNDAEALKIMSRSSYIEMNSWLSQGVERSLVGHNPAQSKALADEIYALGPKQVLAGGGRASMFVVIELPEDAESREKLFAWRNRWTERYGGSPPVEKDVGQQYIYAEMPLNR